MGPPLLSGNNPYEYAGWTPARVTAVVSGSVTGYRFVEIGVAADGTVPTRTGTLQNTSTDVAYPVVAGDTFSVGDTVLVRRSAVAGGTRWEMVKPADSCCGWSADAYTRVHYPANPQVSSGTSQEIDVASSASNTTVAQTLVTATELDLDTSTGVDHVVVGGAIQASVTFSTPGAGVAFSFWVNAYVVRLDVLPGPFAAVTGPIPVVAGQTFEVAGTRRYTGQRNHQSDFTTHQYRGQVALPPLHFASGAAGSGGIPTQLAWAVAVLVNAESGTFPALTVVVDGIGSGGTGLAYDRKCCVTTGTGAGSVTGCCDSELAGHGNRTVVIPDGPGAGTYTAVWDGSSGWAFTVGGGKPGLLYCADGVWHLLNLNSGTDEAATSSACGPFSATFAGAVFLASGNITAS